jgi:hypothetical protein
MNGMALRGVLVVAALAALLGIPPASTAAAGTGLRGAVTRGPVSPVCQFGNSCERPAAHAILMFRRSERLVRAMTDLHGRYTVALAPGTWAVSTAGIAGITPMRIRVIAGVVRTVDFAIDTGIR